jgi:glucose-6-phosphate isomerase
MNTDNTSGAGIDSRRERAWQDVESQVAAVGDASIRARFDSDPQRFETMSIEAAGLFLDYSKNRLDKPTLQKLMALAKACDVEALRDAMFAGERINVTENRSVLHTALRDLSNSQLQVDGVDVLADIRQVRKQLYAFATRVRDGEWVGRSGKSITDVVNIGIGGSDLGPRMVCEALKVYAHPRLRMHFVANIDGDALADVLKAVDPERTLFIVASKTFTTIETLTNAHSARRWFLAQGGTEADIARHFVAVSTNRDAVTAFGIDPANMFPFWDWVGGRYSLWSSIGLAIAICVGAEKFDELLGGAHAMDRHFRSTPLESNMPVLLAMIGIWYRNFLGAGSVAVLPYSEHLHRLPAYLQQLDMESNGKTVTRDGLRVTHATGPIIWGEPGTNGQHAFFQLLHQGSELVPIDFILPVEATHDLPEHHRLLVANCLAQGSALMNGRGIDEVRAELAAKGVVSADIERLALQRSFEGNRPSNTLLMSRLDAAALGALIALYEHKVFVQGVVWNINSFDQWGVELGKVVATDIGDVLAGGKTPGKQDASTRGLVDRILTKRH